MVKPSLQNICFVAVILWYFWLYIAARQTCHLLYSIKCEFDNLSVCQLLFWNIGLSNGNGIRWNFHPYLPTWNWRTFIKTIKYKTPGKLPLQNICFAAVIVWYFWFVYCFIKTCHLLYSMTFLMVLFDETTFYLFFFFLESWLIRHFEVQPQSIKDTFIRWYFWLPVYSLWNLCCLWSFCDNFNCQCSFYITVDCLQVFSV